MARTSLMWFRRDLRLSDNEALHCAVQESDAVVPVFVSDDVLSPSATDRWRDGSLAALQADLETRGSGLRVIPGPAHAALSVLTREHAATHVHCTRVWTPEGLELEHHVSEALSANGAELVVHEGSLLAVPNSISTLAGTPYRVFTPYFRTWKAAQTPTEPLPAPDRIPGETETATDSTRKHSPFLLQGTPGERGAAERLREFISGALDGYGLNRDLPAVDGTSRLSAHLAWGELSPGQVVWSLLDADVPADERDSFVRQIAWREFAHHVLHAFPDLATLPLRPEFAEFPWRDDDAALEAWRTGMTGYPLVDAGMRQLAATGWMHNRVRLVTASFLVKDLLIPWQRGEEYFARTLTDFDPASNAFNWQWVAGSGADAAPYYRVFNPTTQAERFDPADAYAHMWIPELGSSAYPEQIVDHAMARERALEKHRRLGRG